MFFFVYHWLAFFYSPFSLWSADGAFYQTRVKDLSPDSFRNPFHSQSIPCMEPVDLHNLDLVYSYSKRNTKPFLPYSFEILLSILFPSFFLCNHQSKSRDYLFLRFLYFYSFIHSHSLSLIFRCKFTQIIPIHQTKPQKTAYFYHQSPIINH